MKTLLTITWILETITGIALITLPSEVARILLGAPLDAAGSDVARVAGAALLAIGFVCAGSRRVGLPAARPILLGLVIYNWMVVMVLIRAFTIDHMRGIGLWPVAILHTALAIWCMVCLSARKPVPSAAP